MIQILTHFYLTTHKENLSSPPRGCFLFSYSEGHLEQSAPFLVSDVAFISALLNAFMTKLFLCSFLTMACQVWRVKPWVQFLITFCHQWGNHLGCCLSFCRKDKIALVLTGSPVETFFTMRLWEAKASPKVKIETKKKYPPILGTHPNRK